MDFSCHNLTGGGYPLKRASTAPNTPKIPPFGPIFEASESPPCRGGAPPYFGPFWPFLAIFGPFGGVPPPCQPSASPNAPEKSPMKRGQKVLNQGPPLGRAIFDPPDPPGTPPPGGGTPPLRPPPGPPPSPPKNPSFGAPNRLFFGLFWLILIGNDPPEVRFWAFLGHFIPL